MIQVRFHAHACLSLETEGAILLTDPWFDGEVFNESWALRVKPDLARIDFERVRWVWVSHEHPDHFHLPSLRAIRRRVPGPITFLFRKQANQDVRRAAEGLGYRVVELTPGVTTPVWGGVRFTTFHVGMDTMLVVEADGRVLLNQNDCRPDAATIRAIRARFQDIDAWFFYFSIAGYHGNPDDRAQLAAARAERLADPVHYFQLVRPRIFVPFASFSLFCREANDYVNDWSVSLDDVLASCAGLPVEIMWEGDPLLWEAWEARNTANLERWRAVWRMPRVPRPSRPVGDDELTRAGAAFVEAVAAHPKRVRLSAPGECQVRLRDSGRGVSIDCRGARFRLLEQPGAEEVVAELDAEDLLYFLRFPWGGDAVAISSCVAVRDLARWNQLLAFRQEMYWPSRRSLDRVKVAVKHADRVLLGGALRRWLRRRAGAGSGSG